MPSAVFRVQWSQAAVKHLPKPSANLDEPDRGKDLVKIVQVGRKFSMLMLMAGNLRFGSVRFGFVKLECLRFGS